jgi:hypothetical protein
MTTPPPDDQIIDTGIDLIWFDLIDWL